MKWLGEDEPDWNHPGQGIYRRRDGKGSVIRFGSHEWNAQADVGAGMQDVGVGCSAQEGRHLVDDALLNGEIPSLPAVTPGTLFEQVTEKIRRAGFSSSVSTRLHRMKCADGVALGMGEIFDVVICVNRWGMKEGQRSYQVFGEHMREPASSHDDERWKYPQKGEEALNEAIAEALRLLAMQRLCSG